jgi:hypothetical protein
MSSTKKRFNFTPDLKEYIIRSRISEDKKYFMPTPENLLELFNLNVIHGQIEYDMEKYKSFFKKENEENILDLTNIQHILNNKILNSILFFLGAINIENDIYEFDQVEEEEDEIKEPIPEENLFENSQNYIEYLQNNINLLTKNIAFMDIDLTIKSLEEIGLKIVPENSNTLYRQIKDKVMSLPENKILVLITPSNNFYVKTEKNSINGINYDFKINNITKLFLNSEFIKKFILKISNHPRCHFGLLSSMLQKNLKTANSGMSTMFNTIYPRHISLIDQRSHDVIDLDKKGVVPKFFRNLELILKHIKTKDKLYCFNKTNVLIIESKDFKIKEEKKPESTKLNSINISVINEELLKKPSLERKRLIEEKGERLINYVYDLLENCPNDVRDYLQNHPFESN